MDDSGASPGTPETAVATPPPPEAHDVALTEEQMKAVAPDVLADSVGDYFRAWGTRIRNGESGALPIVVGLIAITIFFQLEDSKFLTGGNLVLLMIQAAAYIVFGAAEIFALLLSEIDLSVGYTAAVGAFVIAELIAPPVSLPWWLGIIGGLMATAFIGFIQGSLITRLNLPSFVVTLGGFLCMEGVMLELADVDKHAVGGVIGIDSNSPIYKLVNNNIPMWLSWLLLAAGIVGFAAFAVFKWRSRKAQGLTVPPFGITVLTIVLTAIGGIVVVWLCSINRGTKFFHVTGVPYVVPLVLVVLLFWTWLLSRTRLGRYIYAIGANPEAARRAGINVNRIRTIGFMLCSMTAGIGGLIYESRLGNMSVDFDGSTYVLYAVAAAVIGGTSLFGGRGKPMHALLGGIVIAAVFNGLGLMGVTNAVQDIATAVVLVAAVTLDALVRRRSSTLS